MDFLNLYQILPALLTIIKLLTDLRERAQLSEGQKRLAETFVVPLTKMKESHEQYADAHFATIGAISVAQSLDFPFTKDYAEHLTENYRRTYTQFVSDTVFLLRCMEARKSSMEKHFPELWLLIEPLVYSLAHDKLDWEFAYCTVDFEKCCLHLESGEEFSEDLNGRMMALFEELGIPTLPLSPISEKP